MSSYVDPTFVNQPPNLSRHLASGWASRFQHLLHPSTWWLTSPWSATLSSSLSCCVNTKTLRLASFQAAGRLYSAAEGYKLDIQWPARWPKFWWLTWLYISLYIYLLTWKLRCLGPGHFWDPFQLSYFSNWNPTQNPVLGVAGEWLKIKRDFSLLANWGKKTTWVGTYFPICVNVNSRICGPAVGDKGKPSAMGGMRAGPWGKPFSRGPGQETAPVPDPVLVLMKFTFPQTLRA